MKLLQLWGATYQQPYWRVAFKVEKVVGGPHSNIWHLQEGRSEHKDENADAEPGAQQAPRRRWVRPKERQIQNLFARFNSKAMSLNDWNITQGFVIRLYICMFAIYTFNIVCHSLWWFDLKCMSWSQENFSWSRENRSHESWFWESWSQETKS